MKQTILKCDCCGKEFYTEYYKGGYIDHFKNFVGNMPITIKNGQNDIFREICYAGNSLRQDYDIKERLNCFEKYCQKTSNENLVPIVRDLVEQFLENQKNLNEIHDKIVDLVKELDDFEKEYIGLRYQAFDVKRLN